MELSLTSLGRAELTIQREDELIRRLAGFRYLTEPLARGLLFEGSPHTPLSREVITRRILRRLKRKGLIVETPRVTGPTGGGARLVYLLTAAGYNRARKLDPGLSSRQPHLRGTSLMGHALMCAEVALAFRRAAIARSVHQLVEWVYDWQTIERLGADRVVPDGLLVYASREWEFTAFLEVDLATEGARVFAHKVERYIETLRRGDWRVHMPAWPIVLTVASTPGRATVLERVTARVLNESWQAERLKSVCCFLFATIEDVLGPQGPLGRIWTSATEDGWQQILPDDGERRQSDAAHEAHTKRPVRAAALWGGR